MVYYFKAKITKNDELSDFVLDDSANSEEAIIYMGRDKIENDPLIKNSNPKNIWFHVDNYSSAHLYLQLTKDQIINFKQFDQFVIDPSLLEQIAQLTKANSIKANKLNNITVIYTPVENLHTDGSMDIGTVTFKNRKLVKRIHVAKKENSIINKLNKTKTEISTDEFIVQQEELVKQLALERKIQEREQQELNKQYEAQKKSNVDPYGDLFSKENLEQNSNEFRNENWVEEEFW